MAKLKKKNEWLEWGKAFLIAIIFIFFIKTFVFSTSIVEGESMDPTLVDGDRLVFNKFVYLIGNPDRGDVVIIQSAHKNYVKRIIALPGETIEMSNHTLFIDNEQYDQLFISEEAINKTGDFGPLEIPEDNYFVMGDNRAISLDSRHQELGFINKDSIIGRSEFIYYPFDAWAITR